MLSVRLTKGLLLTEFRYGRTHEYTIKNSGKRSKNVLVEYPLEAEWKLIEPKEPTEQPEA